MSGNPTATPTAFHWGSYRALHTGAALTDLQPLPWDGDPSAIGAGFVEARTGPTRIAEPAVRRSFLEAKGPSVGAQRGAEPFVAVDWDTALSLIAQELQRVIRTHGNRAIFAGSYGWASAGRFHHAQSQIHRFMNTIGGYVRSVNAYSYAAAEVILPRVVGSLQQVTRQATSWPVIAKHSRLVVMFGGWPLKNAQVNAGGVARTARAVGWNGVLMPASGSSISARCAVTPNLAWTPNGGRSGPTPMSRSCWGWPTPW